MDFEGLQEESRCWGRETAQKNNMRENDIEENKRRSFDIKNNATDFLLFQQRRMSASLFKMFLIELEGMVDEGLISAEYFVKIRKRILDRAGTDNREFEEYINKFDIYFKI